MTALLLITIGLAILLIAMEGVGLPRLVRRCDAGAKTDWRKAILSLKAAIRALKNAKKEGESDTVFESQSEVTRKRTSAREASANFRKAVNDQVNALRTTRRNRWTTAKTNLNKFLWSLLTATWSTVASGKVISVAGSVLLLVLAFIEVRYYEFFGFNVLPYLPDYPAHTLAVGLLQVFLLLGLLPLIFAAVIVTVPPSAGLLLMSIAHGMRALAAKGIAWAFLAACGRWTPCSYLALPLLEEAPVDSVPSSRSGPVPSPTGQQIPVDKFKNITKLISRSTVGALFVVVCSIAVEFEPRYQVHATCGTAKWSKRIRVVLDPPLAGETSFTRIGSIGGNVFIVPESCGQSQSAGDEADTRHNDQHGDGGEPSEGEQSGLPAGLQSIVEQIEGRLDFHKSRYNKKRPEYPATVTVVPSNRVLCMHEVHEKGSDESAVCKPLPQPGGAGLRIIVHDEWYLKAEIKRKTCRGAAAEISKPVLFQREQTTPVDEDAAREIIKAFLNKPELQDVKLYVLGFASADGSSLYNETLARQRAKAVAVMVQNLAPRRTLLEESWGETHLTNGVANSRSVRLVGCRPEAQDSTDSSAQQARTATAEPREESAVVRWPS